MHGNGNGVMVATRCTATSPASPGWSDANHTSCPTAASGCSGTWRCPGQAAHSGPWAASGTELVPAVVGSWSQSAWAIGRPPALQAPRQVFCMLRLLCLGWLIVPLIAAWHHN